MKIRLAILDEDQNYLNKIVKFFNAKYADKLEVYSFTNKDIALSAIDNSRIDVFLAYNSFDIDVNKIPKRCGFAYFVESNDVEIFNGQPAVSKFQKADLIYKQVLDIYSEKAGRFGLKTDNGNTGVVIFSSPVGGVGTSSVAASYATYLSYRGKKSLYLNLELLGSTEQFFTAEGVSEKSMSDVIYALKSRKANLAMKLESCVRQNSNGVFFYSRSKLALNMLELSTNDIILLITELKAAGFYDYIIIDMRFDLDERALKIYDQAHRLVWVSDGSELSDIKIQEAYKALLIVDEKNTGITLIDRLCLIYNKVDNKSRRTVENTGLKVAGKISYYAHKNAKQVVEQIALTRIFDDIL